MTNLPMLPMLPMIVVAKFAEVTVYQTSALPASAFVATDNDNSAQQNNLGMMQIGQASYGELNLGLHVNDDAEQVLINRMRLLATINQTASQLTSTSQQQAQQQPVIKSLYWVNQVHGKQIHDIDATTLKMCPMNADAMVSQQANIGLAIMTADCVPIVLYQPTTGRIAAIHAGWQGLACGVIKATAERFDDLNDEPIMAWIGACISQAHYEVGIEVAEQLLAGCTSNKLLPISAIENFKSFFCKPSNIGGNNSATGFDDADESFSNLHNTVEKSANIATLNSSDDKQKTTGKMDKLKIDLPKLAMAQLKTLGITIANELPIDCSYADSRYYSYRRQTHQQQPATGRMVLIIVRSIPIES